MATSNYIASGWTATSGAYDQDGLLSGSVPSRDIFNGALTVGVYQIILTTNFDTFKYPVFCSCNDLSNIGMSKTSPCSWLLYPGYGIKLYSQTGWKGVTSNTYYNTTKLPVLLDTNIYREGSTTIKFASLTASIRVYFRGNRSTGNEYEVTIDGLTS